MFFARNGAGVMVDAARGLRAICPLCQSVVVAKCGDIVEWHWAHQTGGDCDPWAENETPWHRWWKERAPEEWREVTMGAGREHRADIRRDDGYVIELQHSPISTEAIIEREVFYRPMVWLLDGRLYSRGASQFGEWIERFSRVRDGVWHWAWPRKSFVAAKKKVFIDLGKTVVEVSKFEEVSRGILSGGRTPGFYVHGVEVTREAFLERAKLRPRAPDDENGVVSWIAEWRVPVSEHKSEVLKKDALRRREFRTEAALIRWHGRSARKQLELVQWLTSGDVVDLEQHPLLQIEISAARQDERVPL